MKLTIEIEVDDNIEPCTYDCGDYCPLSYYDFDFDRFTCDHIKHNENGWECIVSKAMKKGETNE